MITGTICPVGSYGGSLELVCPLRTYVRVLGLNEPSFPIHVHSHSFGLPTSQAAVSDRIHGERFHPLLSSGPVLVRLETRLPLYVRNVGV